MKKKKVGVIASSVAAIAVCSSMVVGSTFALFTSEDTVNIAVTAGQVKLTASVDTENVVSASTLGTEALGTFSSIDGVCAINNIAPGDEFTFTVKAENASTISTLYRTKIEMVDGEESELTSALVVTINDVEYAGLKSYTSGWAKLEANEDPANFTVKVAFRNSDENQNDLQEADAKILVTVEGVQSNAGFELGKPHVEIVEKVALSAFAYDKTEGACVIKGVAEGADATEVVIPTTAGGLPVTFSSGAFANNRSLEKVTIGCAVVPEEAFVGCTNLKEVVLEEGVEKLAYHAFVGAWDGATGNKIETVTLPDSLTTISEGAFAGCGSLKEVNFGENSQLEVIGQDAFRGCSIEKLEIPASVREIGDYAFEGAKFTTVVVPASVKEIGEGAFGGCDKLTEITLSSVELGYKVFSGCKELEVINFNGTQAEWNSMVDAMIEATIAEGHYGIPESVISALFDGAHKDVTVKCSDGTIVLAH